MRKKNDTFGEDFDYCPYCQNEKPSGGCAFFKSGRQLKEFLTDMDSFMPTQCMCSCPGFKMKPGIDPPLPFYDPRGEIADQYRDWKERTAQP